MFSIIRKTKLTPILTSQSPHDLASITQFTQNANFLQKIIDDMIIEYQYMDSPIKTPSKPRRPPSETPTIDQIPHTLLFK